MIVGTAGHIDHGKTTLVRALTGVDTDRLKEEKARGISIELGYAYTPLSNGGILGFVDVPGHERLVHTMAAGACGIDFALLVIAADDGVMPQTREHVAILQLFGVTEGAVALTKVDRVDDVRLRAVEGEIVAFLSGTVFRDAPVFRVNAADAAAVAATAPDPDARGPGTRAGTTADTVEDVGAGAAGITGIAAEAAPGDAEAQDGVGDGTGGAPTAPSASAVAGVAATAGVAGAVGIAGAAGRDVEAGNVGTTALLAYLERVALGFERGASRITGAGRDGTGAGVAAQGAAAGAPSETAATFAAGPTTGTAAAGAAAAGAAAAGAAAAGTLGVPSRRGTSCLADGDARLFRLAVDRVFTLVGHGTVVAGTVFSGSVRTGDNVVVFPSNIPVRVRSIHAQNRPAEVGHVGERCALNLAGVDKGALNRGDWLADARALLPTTRIDVRMDLLPGTNTVLKARAPVHFHHGAAHVTAHVVPLNESVISVGQIRHAQIVFDAPICVLPGDRFIVRDAQAIRTLGGGIVLDPFAQSRKRRSPERMRYLHALERMIAGEGLAPLLAEAPYGAKQSELVRLTGQSPEQMTLPFNAMTVDGSRDRYILLSTAWHALRARAVNALREFHSASPEEPGPDIGRLRRISLPQLPNELWRAMILELARDGTIVRSDPWVHLPGHSVTFSPRENALAEKLRPLIAAGRFDPPWVRDLAGTIKAPEDDVRQVLRKQVTQGALYQVVHDLFYDRKCVAELATVITTLAQEHGTVEAAQYRDAVGLGRKRAIQILEFFDRVGHTRRMRDARVLRADSGWRAG